AGTHLRAIHEAIDRSIGEITASLPPDTTLVIFSVKGMEPADVDVLAPVLVPELLHRVSFGRALLRPALRRGEDLICPVVVPDASTRPFSVVRQSFADGAGARPRRAGRTASRP